MPTHAEWSNALADAKGRAEFLIVKNRDDATGSYHAKHFRHCSMWVGHKVENQHGQSAIELIFGELQCAGITLARSYPRVGISAPHRLNKWLLVVYGLDG